MIIDDKSAEVVVERKERLVGDGKVCHAIRAGRRRKVALFILEIIGTFHWQRVRLTRPTTSWLFFFLNIT